MAEENFAAFIQQERERLNSQREAVFTQQQELETRLHAINRELTAIEAYESAKSGKQAAPTRQARQARAPSQGRRGSKRGALLQLIQQNPAGLTRREILEKMGLKGDKSGEMSVSNALTALTKASQISRRDGKYATA